MNRFFKHFYVIAATVVLFLLAFFVATKEAITPLYFILHDAVGQRDISLFDAEDGNYYVFLPSYAELEQVQIVLPPMQTFCLDDVCLADRMNCDTFELEKPYDFFIDGEFVAKLWFLRSQNIATMYIDTVSGEMTEIHNDKSYEEYASMALYAANGSMDFYDTKSRLKGRGNSTWNCDKHPYLLTLSTDGDLLGMGSAKKWVLLANAYDETNLNNKLVYDLAQEVGFGWSPDCQFVDLYLNGEYNGLYLLAEKIEVYPTRLEINGDAGDYLCMVNTPSRLENMETFFYSHMGRIIEVCYPEKLTQLEIDDISHLIYLMEKDICSGMDLRYSEILDLDSWVRRYLIDEISGNIDSDLTSSYYSFHEGKFCAGPVWDYDMAFGNSLRNQEPNSFIAKNAYKRADRPSPYYSTLYANESFYRRVLELYRQEFAPILERFIENDLDVSIEWIRKASHMNSIRWRTMYDEWIELTAGTGIVRNPTDLKSYYTRRTQFLNSAWLDEKEFCTIQFEIVPGSAYWNISVEKGSYLKTDYLDLVKTEWINTDAGNLVDFQKPVTEDLIVTIKQN